MAQQIIDAFKKLETADGLIEHIPELKKRSAILIPVVCPQEDWVRNIVNLKNWKLIFTIRSRHLKEHAGEVSFPGGRIDKGENPLQTALREAHEEIGLHPSQIHSTISLNKSFARSGYHISPFCSLVLNENHLICNENEVSYIVPLSIDELLKLECWSEERSIMQFKRRVWHYPTKVEGIGDIDIWGATGNILKDLLMRIEFFI
jgi:8-oxo-dGTP pyrophosphatase MutT (NUDIX family)